MGKASSGPFQPFQRISRSCGEAENVQLSGKRQPRSACAASVSQTLNHLHLPNLDVRTGKDFGQLVALFEVFMEMSLLDIPSHQCRASEKRALL